MRSLEDKERMFRKRNMTKKSRNVTRGTFFEGFVATNSHVGQPLEFGAHADNECQITRTENTEHVRDTFGTGFSRCGAQVSKHPRPRNRRIRFHDPAGLAPTSVFPSVVDKAP